MHPAAVQTACRLAGRGGAISSSLRAVLSSARGFGARAACFFASYS
jgi:hypothetical protein